MLALENVLRKLHVHTNKVQKDFDTVSSLSARKRSKPGVFGSKKKPLIEVCEDDDVIKIFSQEKAARNNSALMR